MLEDIRKVHIIGAGGIGLSALAKFFLFQRKIVTGSDLDRTFIIDDLQLSLIC